MSMGKQRNSMKGLKDLVMVDVCISGDNDPFLDSCLRYASFHRLTNRKHIKSLQYSHLSARHKKILI